MAEKKSKKQKEKAEKKALKKEAKESKKKAKLGKKGGTDNPDNIEGKEDAKNKKIFFPLKKIIIIIIMLILLASAFAGYKYFFSNNDEPVVYKSVALKNVNLPDEMLRFSFNNMNDLYYALVTYNLRIFLMNKEIDRISKIGDEYPDQKSIALKEKKTWVSSKTKVEKTFSKIQKTIKEIYVLHTVNKENGELKIKEMSKDLLAQANEALTTLDTYIGKIETSKDEEPKGFINQSLFKMKRLFK